MFTRAAPAMRRAAVLATGTFVAVKSADFLGWNNYGMAAADGSGWFSGGTASGAATSGSKGASSGSVKATVPPTTPPLALQTDFDVVVVGAGIVGLATAREILKRYPHLTVAVIEKEGEVAAHQTGHNSGVIHAGMYYEPGSVMARTCVKGAAMMYEYCAANKLPHERSGKLIVAVNEAEHAAVTALYERGNKNGVQGLRVLNAEEVKAMEPNVAAYSALWSPNTGIADYAAVARHIATELVASGHADVKLRFQVEEFQRLPDGRVRIKGVEPGQPGPAKAVTAKHVITCAGFYSDRVAVLAGGAPNPPIVTFRGTYYQMKDQFKNIVKTNVYPVPSGGGIPVGVHFTPTVNERRGHQMIIGPGACIAFSREGYKMSDIRLADLWDYATNGGLWKFAVSNPRLSIGELYRDFSKSAFLKEAQKLVPSVTEDMVEESFTGVMAQIFESNGKAAKDYIFERKVLGGTTLNVRNAPSPACTASLAIAEHVVDVAEADFGWKDGAAATKA